MMDTATVIGTVEQWSTIQTNRQTDKQTDRQTDGQTDNQSITYVDTVLLLAEY